MTEWAADYIGKKWTQETDCYYWCAEILRAVFSISVPARPDPRQRREWIEVKSPLNGDVIIMQNNSSEPHIGVWHHSDGVVHALNGCGVVLDAVDNLQMYGLKLKKVLRYHG